MTVRTLRLASIAACLIGACSEPTPMTMPDAGLPDAGPPPPTTLREGAPVTFATVYEAVSYQEGPVSRLWYPMDLAVHPSGDLWVVQRMERDPAFDDENECTMRGLAGDPNDCVSLQGSTVAITDPAAAAAATAEEGRASLVVDANAWHFMRRPSAIDFGHPALPYDMTSPGAMDAMVDAPLVYENTFATCHEHMTGNMSDDAAFIGPTLWSADPAIYHGANGSFDWSNGSHLDMVHATPYCMGIAYERDNVYWTFNGHLGALDRYDFGAPHYTGHFDHDDGVVTRFALAEGDGLARLPNVPSNLVIHGTDLYVADTGNGRVLHFDTAAPAVEFGTFRTFEGLMATTMVDLPYTAVADAAALGAAWGGASEPSGLAMLDDETLVVANHATGHISLLGLDGTVIRTIDTGTGPGIGGLAVREGVVYFAQMVERRVIRIDVTPGI